MKALLLTAHGAPDVLKVRDAPEPKVRSGQIRISVRAAGVNFAEVMARQGLYPAAPKPPSILGYEVAGTVESVGDGVTSWRVGDRVIAGTRFGGFAELAVVGEHDALALPQALTFEEGAAIPVAYGTAFAAVARCGNVQPGEWILIHAAAGGVGIAATHVARKIGARIFGTASKGKHAAVRAQGVEHVIDYYNEDVPTEIRKITGGRGLDVVLDARGGHHFKESYDLLRPGGRLVMYGASSVITHERRNLFSALKLLVGMPRFGPLDLMERNRAVIGLNLLELWDDRGSFAEIARPLAQMLAEGHLKPVVGQVFALARAPEAHRFLQQRKNVGKVVLTVS
ncbi:MAG TPA: medium chain dehydrogenase/reductase family protein [Kofleriaceae bacterium]|jgi:NADPH:quinone reductase-like Zn-dependent oxidoreductase